MSDISIKNQLDPLLKQLSRERSFGVAEKIAAEIADLLRIKTAERFLANISRIDAEFTRFQLAPGFARQAAAYELPHDDGKLFDLKLFWVKKTNKTNLSWIVGLTPNFEDAQANDYKNIGIDFVVPETCDSIIILLSNKFKVRALELKDHVTPTQLEIFSSWRKIGETETVDPVELKKILHTKLWESFNFEPINRKFYLELVEHFSVLVHHLEKSFNRKQSVMFTTRLIGRLLFIWFLKKKNLINKNADYFSVPDSEKQTEYYKNQLEKLFFEVLNRDESERSNGDRLTPYLNGGLFDKSATDFYGDSKLTFPSGYFNQLFETLNKYNFTVDESSPEFQYVAIDPEMLGRIFESLLAEQIDEHTGNNKKKATGAFYTPREIVSYMCEQTLVEYLKTKIPEAPDRDHRIEELVRMPEAIFRDQDQNKRDKWRKNLGKDKVLNALDEILILDPAVGSGAFPMGMLNLLVKVYSRIDTAYEKNLEKHKRKILSRSLYGVDIEQTAIEICRLRAWLSIVVDIPEGEKVEPLPNLEFKFVCANTLIPLDDAGDATFTTDHNLKDKLITIRDEYFRTSSKAKKEKLQKDYLKITQSADLFENKKTRQLKSYKPFDISSSSEFYDPELMHGVKAFDIVIGNPPYVRQEEIKQFKADFQRLYKVFSARSDLYTYFYERGMILLKKSGALIYISSNKFMRAKYGVFLRDLIKNNFDIIEVVDFGNVHKFEAITNTLILFLKNEYHEKNIFLFSSDIDVAKKGFAQARLNSDSWTIANNDVLDLKHKIEEIGKLLKKWEVEISYGIKAGYNDAYVINGDQRKIFVVENPKIDSAIKPLLRGRDIGRYVTRFADKYIIISKYRDNTNFSKKYPELVFHLNKFKERLTKRGQVKNGQHHWLELDNNPTDNYLNLFSQPKIIWLELSDKNKFTYTENGECILAGAFMITGKSLKYLLSFLNSKLCLFYFNLICNSSGMDTVQWKKFVVERLPIVDISEEEKKPFIEVVDQILTLKKQNKDADTKNLESQIDQLVYKLYTLTPEEIEIVEKAGKK